MKHPQVALADKFIGQLCDDHHDAQRCLRARVCLAIGYRLTKRTTDEQIVAAVERFAKAKGKGRGKRGGN